MGRRQFTHACGSRHGPHAGVAPVAGGPPHGLAPGGERWRMPAVRAQAPTEGGPCQGGEPGQGVGVRLEG
jgi:hypothetical protein